MGLAAVVALVGLGGYVGAARAGWLRPDEGAMRAQYGLPTSRYITVAAAQNQPLHVVDEGTGPVVVLVHGSFASLHMWDAWAAALKSHYRVIRFDRPGMGLSGPNLQGRYDGEAEASLIAALAQQLKLPPFVLVGTSSAGEGVAHFAATHPGALRAVVLAFDGLLAGHHIPAFWAGILRMNYADPARVTPDTVTQWTQLNNRAQGWPRKFGPRPAFTGTPDDLRAITSPALVLWSDSDPEVPLAKDGRQTLALLGSRDKTLAVVPHCGHMLALECPAPSLGPVRQFLDRVAD